MTQGLGGVLVKSLGSGSWLLSLIVLQAVSVPYPKYMRNPSKGNGWENETDKLDFSWLQTSIGFLIWWPRSSKVAQFGISHSEVSFMPESPYNHSRLQIWPRSEKLSASSSKGSRRCSPVEEPGRAGTCGPSAHPWMRGSTHVGRKTSLQTVYQCLLRLCM